MQMLADMPRPFVLRLREIRNKQLEAQNAHMRSDQNLNPQGEMNNNMMNNPLPGANISREAIEEFMEEFQ